MLILKEFRVPVKNEIFLVLKSSFFIFTGMYKVLETRCEFCGKTFRKSIKLKSIYKFSMSLGEIWYQNVRIQVKIVHVSRVHHES